ncbi:unnamed protein product [Arctogadus glacialis]
MRRGRQSGGGQGKKGELDTLGWLVRLSWQHGERQQVFSRTCSSLSGGLVECGRSLEHGRSQGEGLWYVLDCLRRTRWLTGRTEQERGGGGERRDQQEREEEEVRGQERR